MLAFLKKSTYLLFRLFYFTFIFSIFLALGSDTISQYQFRLGLGGIVFIFWLIGSPKKDQGPKFNFSVLLFAAFLLYEFSRWGWGLWQIHGQGTASIHTIPLKFYADATLRWGALFLFFWLTYFVVRGRRMAQRFLSIMAFSAFFVALNGIPRILIPETGSQINSFAIDGFFRSFFYFAPWVSQYILAQFAHPNYTGDVMAFGFFSALGLMFYAYYILKEKYGRLRRFKWSHPMGNSLLLYLAIVLAIPMAILLLFSRGTILCFSIALVFFFVMLFLRKPSFGLVKFTTVFLIIGGVFLASVGNLSQAIEEMQTLKSETQDSSLGTTMEGATRAYRIYQDYPIWGIGTGRYPYLAKEYRSADLMKRHELSDFESMCHYAHLLAEEGIGAFIYFLFLLVYLAQSISGLWRAKSRFQFLAGLSFLSPVIMVLGHGAFNHLLQRFSMSMLLYISMGATLGVLSRSFQNE